MRKLAGFCCAALLLAPGVALAEGEIEAIAQAGVAKVFDPVENRTHTVTPALLSLRTDVYTGGVFFKAYAWGKNDFREGDLWTEDGHLENAVLGYRFPRGNSQVKVGRFYKFLESGVEQIDGIDAKTDLAGGFSLSGYLGAPVQVPFDNKGDSIYGGKLSWRSQPIELGVSYLHENGAFTAKPNGNVDSDRDLVSGNFLLSPHRMVQLHGNMTYNKVTDGWGENRYHLVVTPTDKVTITADFKKNKYDDYTPSASLQLLRTPDFEQHGRQRYLAAGINIQATKSTDFTLFYRDIDKEFPSFDEDFRYYGLQTRVKSGNWVTGVHYTRADTTGGTLSGISPYHEFYGYTEYKKDRLTASVDGHVVIFEDTVNLFATNPSAQDYAFSTALGYKLTDAMSLTGSVGYNRNPTMGSEVTGNLWLKCNMKI